MKPEPKGVEGRLERIFVLSNVSDEFAFRMGIGITAALTMKKVQKPHVVLKSTFSIEDVDIVVS